MVMSGEPDINDLARQVAVLEERMKTRQAEYESALDRFRADMAQRDKDNMRWHVGLWLAAVVVLGFLIRWPF